MTCRISAFLVGLLSVAALADKAGTEVCNDSATCSKDMAALESEGVELDISEKFNDIDGVAQFQIKAARAIRTDEQAMDASMTSSSTRRSVFFRIPGNVAPAGPNGGLVNQGVVSLMKADKHKGGCPGFCSQDPNVLGALRLNKQNGDIGCACYTTSDEKLGIYDLMKPGEKSIASWSFNTIDSGEGGSRSWEKVTYTTQTDEVADKIAVMVAALDVDQASSSLLIQESAMAQKLALAMEASMSSIARTAFVRIPGNVAPVGPKGGLVKQGVVSLYKANTFGNRPFQDDPQGCVEFCAQDSNILGVVRLNKDNGPIGCVCYTTFWKPDHPYDQLKSGEDSIASWSFDTKPEGGSRAWEKVTYSTQTEAVADTIAKKLAAWDVDQ